MILRKELLSRKEFVLTPFIFLLILTLLSKINSDLQSFSPSFIKGINILTARISAIILNKLSINAKLENNYIFLPFNNQIEIIYECSGVYILFLFFSYILSYPTTLTKKIVGIFWGTIVLYSFNICRITILGLLEYFSPTLFNFFHLYLWEAIYITFVLLIAYIWTNWIAESKIKIQKHLAKFIKNFLYFLLFSILFFIIIRKLLSPYSLFQFYLLKIILESDLLTLENIIEISIDRGIIWLKTIKGPPQPVYLTHLIFNFVPFLSLTVILRFPIWYKILSLFGGSFLLLISQTFWLILIVLKVAKTTSRSFLIFNFYHLFNLALPLLLWTFLYLISKRISPYKEKSESFQENSILQASFTYPPLPNILIYIFFGVTIPLLLLLLAFQITFGYLVAFLIWLIGITFILPHPPTILQVKYKGLAIFTSILLFWQAPFTASMLIYLPPHQRMGLIYSSGKFILLKEGIHFKLPVKREEILFDLTTRFLSFPVIAYNKDGVKIIDAEANVKYRITPESNYQRIYYELGKNMTEIDKSVSSLCRTATILTLSRSNYLRNYQLEGSRKKFRSTILSQCQELMTPYQISIEYFEITNREKAKILL